MTSLEHIKNTARGITAARNLGPGSYVPISLRDQLEDLARLAGVTYEAMSKVTDTDLIGLYQVACKSEPSAKVVASKINGLRDPAFDPFKAEPAPVPGPTGADLDAIRDLIKREVKEGALDSLQGVLDAMASEHATAIARIPSDAVDAATQAMRAELATAAHDAALEALKSITPTMLEIKRPDAADPVPLGLVHKKTPQVIAALSAGINVYLYGPAGSGKTTLAEKVATAFGLKAYYAAKVESEYQLLGFKDAKGETVRTQFREAYEHGGVFLFDELDGSAPSAVVALNMALANGVCPFPDGMVQRHKDFVCIGAGNTKLTGANRQYAGRNQLDAASIDRFAFIEFGYDDDLETALAGDASWCKYVQRVRAVVAERGLNHLVTPRATYDGCKLLASGIDRETVAAMVVYKGLDADTVRQIEAAL